MEYCSGGELKDHVEAKNGLDELECRDLIGQVISGIRQCHDKGIVHRDLKLENIIFKTRAKTVAKICDFGIAGVKK